ncbi:MAG: RNA polymerase sigma factor [Acidobacteriota bacterium]
MSWSKHQITREEYSRIRGLVRAKAKEFGVHYDDLEDLVQETFFHAQKALSEDRFRDRSALDTWIVGIAKKRCLKYHRARRAAKRDAVEVPFDAPQGLGSLAPPRAVEASPEEAAVNRQLLQRVSRSLAELPEKLRQPLVLVAAGREYREVASVLGISVDLVTSRIHQARAKLRQKHQRRTPTR